MDQAINTAPVDMIKNPYLIASLIQAIYAGMFLLSKAALNQGMNSSVFIFYRQAAATLFLAPIVLLVERKRITPLSFAVFAKTFMLALCGLAIGLNLYSIALEYTSSTLAAATTNTLPAITFFLAVLWKMETLNLRNIAGRAKVVGILVCLFGAAAIAVYKGPQFKLFNLHIHLFDKNIPNQGHAESSKKWIKGVLLMLSSNFLWGMWLVLQREVMKSYPSKLQFTTMACALSTVQCFFLALAFEPHFSRWKLGFDVGLVAIAYTGMVVTGVTFYMQAWCIEKKGPVFLAMSTPLALIITMICSTFMLGELISLGSIVGGSLMIGGLYCVLWGKRKEDHGGNSGTKADIVAVQEQAGLKNNVQELAVVDCV